jgi:hypothetical protein
MKIYIKSVLVVALVAFSTVRCTDHFDALNTDPTAAGPEQFNPNFLLTTAQLRYTGSADFSYETWRAQLIHFSTMMQHFSHVATYWVGDKYLQNYDYNAAYFERAYDEQVKHIVDLIELTKDDPEQANLYQIARIWKAVIFHRLTDIYGDVPYFEAGQGYYQRIFDPVYDTQEAIYTDMLKELDEAGAALDPSKDIPTGDMIYQGDIAKWKKFANAMMLRLAMRLTDADAGKSKLYAEKASANLFTGIEDNAFVVHDASKGRPTVNRISQILNLPYELPYIRWSKTFIDFLQTNNDPRLPVLAELPDGTTAAGSQQGMPNGYDLLSGATNIVNEPDYPGPAGDDALGNYSRPINSIYAKMDGPTFIITYAETELLLAEAKFRSYSVPGTAAEHYNNGVTAAMKQLSQFDAAATVSDANIAAYLAAHPYVDADGMEMIHTQYWAATIFNDYETFANWRRTGIPDLVPVNYPGNVTGGTIPRRLVYPAGEQSRNGVNYEEAVARIPGGVDNMTSRVWWDQ